MNKTKNHWKKLTVATGAIALLWFILVKSDSSDSEHLTFTTRQGNLVINVLEGGTVEALESQKIRSEIKGYEGTKILCIVDEGYQITAEDVSAKKILVVLDSSKLEDREKTQQISLESTSASLIEAVNGKEIQIS